MSEPKFKIGDRVLIPTTVGWAGYNFPLTLEGEVLNESSPPNSYYGRQYRVRVTLPGGAFAEVRFFEADLKTPPRSEVVDVKVELLDQGEGGPNLPRLNASIKVRDHGICIGFDGYGDLISPEGHGHPILVEYYHGHPRVVIWGDINEEDPTHIISLADTEEAKRIDDQPN